MIVGLLLRHYKNYSKSRFIPLLDDTENMFTVYIGNNGVGKSAILEALDVVLNNRRQSWNISQGQKKAEAYICPLFLIPKNSINTSKRNKDIEVISDFFWGMSELDTTAFSSNPELKKFLEYKNSLKKYEKSHYLILVGISNDSTGAYFGSTFDSNVKELLGDSDEIRNERANTVKDLVLAQYSYLYIPVEESPSELLQLRNETMQKLLNKDIQIEIEKILNSKQENASIVSQINKNLESFMNDVNDIVSKLDPDYSFAAESGCKQKLTAKDIRAKIIEAFFPLRALKKGSRRVELLSSGEQRRAIIDVAYSTLIANKDKKTESNIILAIDEPETSMHISNCFNQFSRLEELSRKSIQVILTTHWYGYLPIAQKGTMHYLESVDNQTNIRTFSLYNLMENRRNYPDDVELKSMFDLASSLISYMRRDESIKWVFCEGSDDKIYLETILRNYKNLRIIPLGGCGNVIKLYQILMSFMTENNEKAHSDIVFLMDTDPNRIPVKEPFVLSSSKVPILLRRLQIDKTDRIALVDPLASGGLYTQTEIEDCLDPELYYKAVEETVNQIGDKKIKKIFSYYKFINGSKTSVFRGDKSCICPTDLKYIQNKIDVINFVENDENKTIIAKNYANLCVGKNINHQLGDLLVDSLDLNKTTTS